MVALHPEVLWAQRSNESDETKNIVYLTINLPDIQEPSLKFNLSSTGLTFDATTGNAEKGIAEKEYSFKLDFFEEVNVEKSTQRLTTRSLALILRKAEAKSEYWPRLTKEKIKTQFIKTDFGKWKDEDEQEEGAEPEADEGGDPMGGMGGMGGMPPGMGGMGGMPPGMGGMGGMGGGAGGFDMEALMKQMGQGGLGGAGGPGGPSGGDDSDEEDDDDGPPPLEDAEPSK